MSKHTKGPWKILPEECGKDYIRIRGSRLGERYKIANVITPVYANVHNRELEETRANARLIAASPDLYAVLKELQESAAYWSEYDVPLGIVDRINQAIAKAEGTT